MTSASNTKLADDIEGTTNAKVSAFHTRNAVLVFAVFGLILILIDTILYVTRLILRLPIIFDSVVSTDAQQSELFMSGSRPSSPLSCLSWA